MKNDFQMDGSDPSPSGEGRPRRRRALEARREADRKRQELFDKTSREIDEIIAEHNAKLPREIATASGAVYLRYSTRFQDSVADQLREILRFALTQNIYVPRDLVFFDLAVRGCTNSRLGLDKLRNALKRKAARVLLLFSTSRLFRKQYRTLAFVDQVHRGLGVRCVFVKSGVDTDDRQRWESLLSMQAMFDQFFVTMNVANIQAAHQGLLEKRIVFGTLSFGYAGEPLPGQFTKRGRPRCQIVMDLVAAKVVQQIFYWYVHDGLAIAEIVRRLNEDDSVPLPPRSTNGEWTFLAVRKILANTRYKGLWKYGVTESVFLPDEDYTRQYQRSEPLKEIQIDELRIVSDSDWCAAQVRLAQAAREGGRKPIDEDRVPRPKVLNRLLHCPDHDILYVAGPYGRVMICPACRRLPAKRRTLFTHLNRPLAVDVICSKLADLIRHDAELVEQSLAACQLEVESIQRPNPVRLTQLEQQIENCQRRIKFIRRTVGDTPEDETAAENEIKELQYQLRCVVAERDQQVIAMAQQPVMPTRDEVGALLQDFRQILIAAATNTASPEEQTAAREVIELLTGGRIEVFQRGERRAKQGWLEGRFQVRLLPILVERLTGAPATCMNDALEVVVEFRRPDRENEEVERAWQLNSRGVLRREIATALGCSKSKVTKLLKDAALRHGEAFEDGRSRRSGLSKKHVEPQLYAIIVDEVMKRYRNLELLQNIAEAVGVCKETITQIVRKWHEDRALVVPDGRTRRKQLPKNLSRRDLPPNAA